MIGQDCRGVYYSEKNSSCKDDFGIVCKIFSKFSRIFWQDFEDIEGFGDF
jgi:hypothetical protein